MRHTLRPRRRSPRTRAALPLALFASVSRVLAAGAAAASAKTVALHLFPRDTSSKFLDPQGHPLPPNSPPAVSHTVDYTGV